MINVINYTCAVPDVQCLLNVLHLALFLFCLLDVSQIEDSTL